MKSMVPVTWGLIWHDKRYKVVMIALCHIVLVLYGIFLTAMDMINEQYPLSIHELTYVLSYYFLHSLLIALLLIGTKKMLPLLYAPWLLVFLTVFAIASCIWIKSILNSSTLYVGPLLVNLAVLGACWLGWFTVTKECLFLFSKSKMRYRIWA